jgi:hypothetical protein
MEKKKWEKSALSSKISENDFTAIGRDSSRGFSWELRIKYS